MSTNYYFINKESRVEVEEFNNNLTMIFDTFTEQMKNLGVENTLSIELEKWMYEKEVERIHIGKRSYGWKPIFEAGEYFKSMKEMREWYHTNKDNFSIENEYGKELTWLELESELFEWEGEVSHIELKYGHHYVCEDGFEWTHGEFS